MISMTGFAQNDIIINNIKYNFSIRSLNSNKGLDVGVKIPRYLFNIENEIRKHINVKLVRGKVDFRILEASENNQIKIDQQKLKSHIRILKKISPQSDDGAVLNAAISLPEVYSKENKKIDSDDERRFLNNFKTLLDKLSRFREKEGRILKKEILTYVKSIQKIVKKLHKLEKIRLADKKKKILKNFSSLDKVYTIDESRLEQELLYYFEKNDITEERVRLEHHCNYFISIIKDDKYVGRKLNFLCQEILREINTIGSKANNFEIQKNVILMKEFLEQTKEQLQNIL